MSLHRKYTFVLLLVLAIVLSACSPLIGKWQAQDNPDDSWDFREGGTVIREYNGDVDVFSYRIVDDGILSLTGPNWLGITVTQTITYSIEEDILTLKSNVQNWSLERVR